MLDAVDERRIADLLGEMTLDEKLLLIGGADAWRTHGIPRLGIQPIKVTDGPHGARGGTFGEVPSASFPCGTAFGATWDRDLMREVGVAIAEEAKQKHCHVLLGPTLNLHRHPLAGRNFECYSEDPFLTSAIGLAFIQGVQSRGVAATAKHFVCNDSEFERMSISSEVDERALHELYLAPFDAAVHEGGAWAAMTAYNRINGTYASEHAELISLLKDEWGFDGLLMSDWWGTYSTACAEAGLDLEMPGRARFFGRRLREAIEAGEIDPAVLDDKVRRILRLAVRTGALDGPAESDEGSTEQPGRPELIERVSTASMVLLKNEGALLPLSLHAGASVALIGPHADKLCMQGGGSSSVEPYRTTSLAAALRGQLVGDDITISHEPGCSITRRIPVLAESLTTPSGESGVYVEFFEGGRFEGGPVVTKVIPHFEMRWIAKSTPVQGEFSLRARASFAPAVSGSHRFSLGGNGVSRLFVNGEALLERTDDPAVGSTGDPATSAADVELDAGVPYELLLEYQPGGRVGIPGVSVGCQPPVAAGAMERAVELAGRADVVVLVAGLTPEWEAEGRDRASLALPGEQDELIRRVLEVNPNTVVVLNAGSPVAMPWIEHARAVLQLWYPGQEGGEALSNVLLGNAEPGGRLPTTFAARVEDHPSHLTYPGEAGSVHYGEGVFIGYRAFERLKREPVFAFGYGLGYTTFAIGSPRLNKSERVAGEAVTVSVAVENTGDRPGATVLQVYVRDVESTLLRPEKELKGFARVHLGAGESTEVTVELGPRAFAAWDPRVHGWVEEAGEFEILVGASSVEIAGSARLTTAGPAPIPAASRANFIQD